MKGHKNKLQKLNKTQLRAGISDVLVKHGMPEDGLAGALREIMEYTSAYTNFQASETLRTYKVAVLTNNYNDVDGAFDYDGIATAVLSDALLRHNVLKELEHEQAKA